MESTNGIWCIYIYNYIYLNNTVYGKDNQFLKMGIYDNVIIGNEQYIPIMAI